MVLLVHKKSKSINEFTGFVMNKVNSSQICQLLSDWQRVDMDK